MASPRSVVLVALLAAMAGAAASLWLQPGLMLRLTGTEPAQQVLQAVLAQRAPEPPAGVIVAQRGDIVPDMNLHTVDGETVALPAAWAGRPTLVNLWASWCAPCLQEMPELQAFADQSAGNGMQVVGIALDDPAAAGVMLERLGIRYPNLVDPPGPADAGVRLGNAGGVLPYSLLVGADGRILKTRIGPFRDVGDIAEWTTMPARASL